MFAVSLPDQSRTVHRCVITPIAGGTTSFLYERGGRTQSFVGVVPVWNWPANSLTGSTGRTRSAGTYRGPLTAATALISLAFVVCSGGLYCLSPLLCSGKREVGSGCFTGRLYGMRKTVEFDETFQGRSDVNNRIM